MPGSTDKPRVLLALNKQMWEDVSWPQVRARLAAEADYHVEFFDLPSDWTVPPEADAETEQRLIAAATAARADALIVSHGAPRITGAILDQLPLVRFVGELEGDRFAARIDAEACWQRDVRVVDTNNFCSPPVAEWALALMLMGLRNYGVLFRRAVIDRKSGAPENWRSDPGFVNAELTGKTVGLIGFGHIARRLLQLLAPFGTTTYVYDPYVPAEFAEIYGVTSTTLDNVLTLSDVVVCLAPITPRTQGMLGARELGLMKDGAVFVNVSRGQIVQSGALLERARAGKLIACLDVHDPEPLAGDSPFIDVPTTILSPHIAGGVAAGRPRSLELMLDELGRFFAGHDTWYTILPRTLANRYGAPVPAQSPPAVRP